MVDIPTAASGAYTLNGANALNQAIDLVLPFSEAFLCRIKAFSKPGYASMYLGLCLERVTYKLFVGSLISGIGKARM